MAGTITRRPLPALIALLALLLLTALVWWRVMGRDDDSSAADAKPCPTPSTSAPAPGTPSTLPPQRTVDVEVLNATTRSGIAAKARTTLLRDGFKASQRAGNDDMAKSVTGQGQIRFSAANKPGALLLQYYFPGAELKQVTTTAAQVTISLGPAYTSIQPQKTVAARLAADRVTLTTTVPTPASSPTSSCSPTAGS